MKPQDFKQPAASAAVPVARHRVIVVGPGF
jgi:hypothetical protein